MQTKILSITKPYNLKLEYAEIGKGSPFLFLPGGGVNFQYYEQFLNHLAKYFHVYTFCYPGFGKSSKIDYIDQYKIVEIILNLVEGLNIDKFIISGHSLGGGLALLFSSLYQEYVLKAITISPLINPVRKNLILKYIKMMADLQYLKKTIKGSDTRKFYKRVVPLDKTDIKTLEIYNKMVHNFDISNSLEKIKNNVLILLGENDVIVDVKNYIKDLEKIDKKKIVKFENEGHYIIHTQEEKVIKEILTFISQD